MKPKILFFDNDGTLMDTEILYFLAGQKVLEKRGIRIEREYYVKNVMNTSSGMMGYAQRSGISKGDIHHIRNERNKMFEDFLKSSDHSIIGANEILQFFFQKIPMAMVTSSQQDHLELMHTHTDFLKYFRFCITGDMVDRTKPDPSLYLLALERSGYSPKECFAIEDSEHGIKAAKQAGIPCVAIPNEFSKEHDYSEADIVIDSLSELKDIVEV